MIDLHLNIDIKTLPEDEARNKIDHINKIAGHFCSIKNFEECKYCSDNALEMATAINYDKGIADAKYYLGLISYSAENYPEAVLNFIESEKLYESVNDFKNQAKVYQELGVTYWQIGDYANEIECFFKALKIFRDTGQKKEEANCLNSIGNYHLEMGEYESALEYHKMSLVLKKDFKDIRGIILTLYNMAMTHNNIGSGKTAKGNYDEASYSYKTALKYYLKALEFNTKIEQDLFFKNRIMQNLGLTYSNLNDFEKPMEIFAECIDYFTKTGNEIDKCDTLVFMAINYTAMGDTENAKKTFFKAIEIAERLNIKRLILTARRYLGEFYKRSGNFKLALPNFRKYAELEFERTKTLLDGDIKRLNVMHKVDVAKKETEMLTDKNEHLRALNLELKKLNSEKNYFLNVTANDLKIPLDKISAKIHSTKTEEKEKKLNNLSEILLESSYMQRIVSDLLILNESEASQA